MHPTANVRPLWLTVMTVMAVVLAFIPAGHAEPNQTIRIRAAGFEMGKENSVSTPTNRLEFALENSGAIPFTQSAVKQGTEVARFGPDAKKPLLHRAFRDADSAVERDE